MHPKPSARFFAVAAAATLLLSATAVRAGSPGEDEGEAEAPASVAVAETETETEDADDPNTGALSVTFDNSFTTAYMFRGILNERDGLIWQPSIELSLNLFEREEGIVQSIDAGVGVWLSVHSRDTLATGDGPDAIYEADYYPSLSLSWAGGITTAATYYFYTGPNGSFRTVEELVFDISYDDSELLGAFSLSPTATFAFETHRSSFGGIGKGAVLELGVEPGYEWTLPFDGAEEYPLGIAVPVRLALSLDDYYRDGPENDTFGYALIGLHVGVPIACIPARYGEWSITNGFDVYFLNDVLEDVNQNDGVYPVWTSSITMEY